VRVGQSQVRVSKPALGRDWLKSVETLLRLLSAKPQLAAASAG
jgi:hypothetical protein